MTILAVDAGTSTIKAVAFSNDGRELHVARRETVVECPREGWSEQDMNVIWASLCDAAAETTQAVGRIEVVALTAQGDGCWLIDAAGDPVRPALLWNDARASSYAEAWAADGTMERSYAINGTVTFPGLANALLRWLAKNEPESLRKAAHVLTCGSWLFCKATGTVRAEFSDAFAPFMNARTGQYADELLSLYGLDACKPLLPPVGAAIAPIKDDLARTMMLPPGIPVVLAPYDVPSAALGAGACDPGDAIVILGTTFVCGIVTDRPVIDLEPAGCLVPLGLQSRYLRFHPTLAGMEVLHWAAQMIGLADARNLVALAAEAPPGANGVLFLPYLSPAGERAPFLDSAARGSFWNLSLDHSRSDIARAVLEGLCMVVRDCIEAIGLRPNSLRLSGGGSTSDALCQQLVDIVGIEAQRASPSELTCRGAALYARLARGDDFALARWRSTSDVRWMPNAGTAGFYARQFDKFRSLRELARQQWRSALYPDGCTR